MRLLWIAPHNIHLEPLINGLMSLGRYDIQIHWLGENGIPVDRGMLDCASSTSPDLIVYTGENGGSLVPSVNTLIHLRKIAPTVFMCHDASDITWKRYLDEYMARDVFTAIISIDGNKDWNHRPQDITALTPHDPRFYQ